MDEIRPSFTAETLAVLATKLGLPIDIIVDKPSAAERLARYEGLLLGYLDDAVETSRDPHMRADSARDPSPRDIGRGTASRSPWRLALMADTPTSRRAYAMALDARRPRLLGTRPVANASGCGVERGGDSPPPAAWKIELAGASGGYVPDGELRSAHSPSAHHQRAGRELRADWVKSAALLQ